MPIIRAGDGHVSPPADYLTFQLAWDALSGTDQGGDVDLYGLGDCGTAFTPTGTSVNKWVARTEGVDYDGTSATRSQLAILYRPNLQALIDIRHMRISSNNAFQHVMSLNAGSQGSIYEYLSLDHPNAAGVDVVNVNATVAGAILRFSDLKGGINGIDFGFNRKLETANLIVFGATGDGLEGSAGSEPTTDVFSFSNGANDFISLTLSTCASEDLTGTFTGYTSAELVDFAGGDYRTKSTSALATLGSGGSFIGAFLEPAAGVTGTGALDSNTSTLTGAAERILTGAGDFASPSALLDGTGTVGAIITGTGDLVSTDSNLVGTAERVIIGTSTLASTEAVITGTGTVLGVISGTGTLPSEPSLLSGTGEIKHTGTGVLNSTVATLAGVAERVITSSGSLASARSLLDGIGAIEGAIVGTGTLEATTSAVAGTGTRIVKGSGALISETAKLIGLGQRIITGISSLVTTDSELTGVGTVGAVTTGTGSLDSQVSAISGTGKITKEGTGTLVSNIASLQGLGKRIIIGAGDLQSAPSLLNGFAVPDVDTPENRLGSVAASNRTATAPLNTRNASATTNTIRRAQVEI